MHYIVKIPSDPGLAYCVDSPAAKEKKILWDENGKLISFRHGVEIPGALPPLFITTDKKHGVKFQDVIPNQSLNFVISEKFSHLLKLEGVKNIQLFPVKIKDFKSKKLYDYLICNVIGLVPCLDWTASEIDLDKKDSSKIFMIRRLYIDEKAVQETANNLKIFRMQESSRYLIVCEELKKSITEAGITGIYFLNSGEIGDFL